MKTRLFPLLAVSLLSVASTTATAQTPAANGAARAWGSNESGQLGNNSNTGSLVPTAVYGLDGGVTAVAVSGGHSLAVQGGKVYAWGKDSDHQLGDNSTTSRPVPEPVLGLTSIAVIAAGAAHSLAIQDGYVLAWGSNTYGQIGERPAYSYSYPAVVANLGDGVVAIAAGAYHNLAIRNGAVLAWGYNGSGQLGRSSVTQSSKPLLVDPFFEGATAIAAGGSHSMAIQKGVLYAWGYNVDGELGIGTTSAKSGPAAVVGLSTGVTSIAAGYTHSLAVQNGNVFAWGYNGQGELGDGTTNSSATPVQVDPANLHDIVAVAAGQHSSYALASDGSLWVWGNNDSGQLGLGNTTPFLTPQHLLPPRGYVYTAIAPDAYGQSVVAVLQAAPTPAFFDGQTALGSGAYYLAFAGGNIFGYYSFLSDPAYIYHFDLGYEYVFDAADGKGGVYLYDFQSGTFFYTSPAFPFPYLYDFTLNTVLYYYPDPNNAGRYNTNGVRYFYRFDTGQIIVK